MYRITVQSTAHREFHDEAVNTSPVKQEDLLRMGRKMTLHQEEVRLNILKIIYFFLILSSIALEAFVCITWHQTDSYLLLALAGTTVMTIIGGVLGLVGTFVAIRELKMRPQNPMQMKLSTPGHNLLIFSFYFLLYIFSSYLVFGSGALFFQDQSLSFLEAKHSDEAAWTSSFHTQQLNEVLDFTSLMITIAGYSCLFTDIIIGVSIYYIFVLSAVWEVIHKVLMVICIVLLFLGLGILYLAGVGEMMIKYLDFEDIVPGWMSLAAIVVGFVTCVAAVQGYFMAHGEKNGAIRCFMLMQLVVLGASLVFGIGALMAAGHFKEKLNSSCYDSLSLIDRDYTPVLGCDQKYIDIARTESQLTCPKEQIRVIWETELDSQGVLYGCLNSDCCASLVASAKSVFDYMGIQALVTVVIVSVAFWGISYLVENLNKFGVSQNHDKDYRFLLSMILFSTLFALMLYMNLRLQPRQPPHKDALLVVNNAGTVDQRWLQSGGCYNGLILPDIENLTQKCTFCDTSKTYATVYTPTGRLYRPSKVVVDDGEITANSWSFSSGKVTYIARTVADLTVCPLCPGDNLGLEVRLYQLDGTNKQPVSLGNVTFALSSESIRTQEVVGRVPGSGSVQVTGEYGSGCSPVTTTTDSDGRFSLQFPLNTDQSPYNSVISTANGGKITQQIGGLPLVSRIVLPSMESLPQSSLYSRLTARVVDCYNGFPVVNATVYLREWGNNVTGAPLAVGSSGRDGAVLFPNLQPGMYTVVAQAKGYTSDVSEIAIPGGAYSDHTFQLCFDNLTPKQVRFHLSWSGSDVDFDLRAAFQVDNNYFCHVDYAETYCGSAKLVKQTKTGLEGEVLLLKEVSAGRYLVYVTRYPPGKGLPDHFKLDLKVYIPGQSLPFYRMHLPLDTTGVSDE